jgi:chromosome partitioning protein
MRLIAMINQKGGVGKTTTAVNVAAGLARWGSRVLLVDLDPQAHATMHVGVDTTSGQPGLYEVLMNDVAASEALREVSDKLAVLPSNLDLVAAESELSQRAQRESALHRVLQPLHDRFDFFIVDCPPSLGTLTINALVAAREVVIPLQPHFLALQGLGMLLETATAVRGVLNPALRVTGVVLCMYDKGTRLAQEVEADVRQFIASAATDDVWHGARVFDTTIRRNIKLAECPSFGRTIFDYAPGSNGAEDYANLAREMLEGTSSPSRTAEAGDAAGETRIIQVATAEADTVLPPGPRPTSPRSEAYPPVTSNTTTP